MFNSTLYIAENNAQNNLDLSFDTAGIEEIPPLPANTKAETTPQKTIQTSQTTEAGTSSSVGLISLCISAVILIFCILFLIFRKILSSMPVKKIPKNPDDIKVTEIISPQTEIEEDEQISENYINEPEKQSLKLSTPSNINRCIRNFLNITKGQ